MVQWGLRGHQVRWRGWSVLGAMLQPRNHILGQVSGRASSQAMRSASLPMIAVLGLPGVIALQDLGVALLFRLMGAFLTSQLCTAERMPPMTGRTSMEALPPSFVALQWETITGSVPVATTPRKNPVCQFRKMPVSLPTAEC